jgi:hypothetical protein
MANSLGRLLVSLGLDASEFTSGMSKSEAQAQRFGQRLERSITAGVLKAQIAMEVLVQAARLAGEAFQVLTTGAADFKDLEETTGASAESIASLAVAAATAGVEISSVAGSMNKLTKGLVGVDDESKAVGAALKAIGINVKDFKSLDPAAQYEAVGKALGGYADGAGKVAIAQALFGKQGAEQLKVFKALEEAGGRQTILTQAQIELADAYADRQAKASAELRIYAQAAASSALPALTALTDAGTELVKSLLGVDKATGALATNNAIAEFARDAAIAIATLLESLLALVKAARAVGGSFQSVAADSDYLVEVTKNLANPGRLLYEENRKALADALERRNKTAQEANQRYVDLWNYDGARMSNAVRAATDPRARRLDASTDPRSTTFQGGEKPKITFEGPPDTAAANQAAQEQRRILDGQLRLVRDFAQQQADAYAFANQYARGAYDDGLQSLSAFFESQKAIRAAGLTSQLEAIDKEIAALQAYGQKAAKPEQRIDAENKIADAMAKRADLARKAAQEGILANQDEARALKQLQDRYDDFRATLLSLQGDRGGAAAIGIDKQAETFRKLLTQSGRDPAEADTFKRLATDTEALKKVQDDYNRLLEQARMQEELIGIAARDSGASEMEVMGQVAAARRGSLADLDALVERANELALALGTPEAIAFAERLGVAFKRATAEVDPMLQKLRDVGEQLGSSLGRAFEDFIVEGKDAKDVVQSLWKEIARMAIQEAVTKPLKNWLGNLFSGMGGGGGGAGGGSQGGGVNWVSLIGSFFGGFFADGGYLGAGKWGIAGERGPELIRGPANVMPMNKGMQMAPQGYRGAAGVTINQTIIAQAGASRNEVMQASLAAKNAAVAEILEMQRRGRSQSGGN